MQTPGIFWIAIRPCKIDNERCGKIETRLEEVNNWVVLRNPKALDVNFASKLSLFVKGVNLEYRLSTEMTQVRRMIQILVFDIKVFQSSP